MKLRDEELKEAENVEEELEGEQSVNPNKPVTLDKLIERLTSHSTSGFGEYF